MGEKIFHENQQKARKVPLQEGPYTLKEKVKFECYGFEIIEKEVRRSGSTGRVYLPPDWQGKSVKIIRID